MRWILMVPLLLLALTGCPKAEPPPAMPQVQVSTADGKPVWPPSGEGCAALVACCDAMSATDPTVGLVCQLAAAAKGSCAEMKEAATGYFRETKHTPPAVCD